VGRDRGRAKAVTDLAIACQDGRRDPREHFISLEDATRRVAGCVEFVNGEPIESKSGWGTWVPQERFVAQLDEDMTAGRARRLPDNFSIFFSREQRVWTVRGCCVGGSVDGPCVKFPVYFQCEQLWEFEGCKVKAFFDPYTENVQGTLVLMDEWRSYKPGHIIASDVPALDLPPQFVMAADGWAGDEEQKRQLAIRKAVAKAVRTEMWNYRGGRRTEARDGLGNVAVVNQSRGGSQPQPNPGMAMTRPQAMATGSLPGRSTIPAADVQPVRKRGAGVTQDEFQRQAAKLALYE
jgi:hypothetical protein